MPSKILNKKLDFHGFWREPRLSGSFWTLNKKSNNKKWKKYNNFTVEYIYLDGNYFIPREQNQKIARITKKNLDSEPSFFDELFCDTEKVIKDYQKIKTLKKDGYSFLLFLKEHRKLIFFWQIYTQLNKSLTLYLEEKASSFENINCLDYIIIKRNTILMKEKQNFSKLHSCYKNKRNFGILLQEYFKRYQFVGTHAYGGTPQTMKSILEKLKTYKPEEKINFQPKRDNFYLANKKAIDIASTAAFYRMFCAENFTEVSFLFWSYLKTLSRRHGLTLEQLKNYSPLEIEELILTGKKISEEEIEERIECPGFIREGNNLLNFKRHEIKALLEKLKPMKNTDQKIFQGMPASYGAARGPAKISLTAALARKVKKGDILVAFETTPDYIIAMKKAAAILTEQGGITSHAAIVSREMKKPCIVGLKGITGALKDGDLIEVNATNGMVRLLK